MLFFCYRDVTMTLRHWMNKIAAPVTLAFVSLTLQASTLEEFYGHYKNAQYAQAIETLEKIDSKDHTLTISLRAYLKGLSFAKIQEYDKAIIQFELAIKENNESIDLHYEYGQALYAANELKKAREAFKISATKNFNKHPSLYYVAHISQILEEFETARDYYTQILKDKNTDLKMKQIANFQLAETLLSIAREKSQEPQDTLRRVEKFILPLFNSAYNLDKSSNIAPEISQRSAEIMTEFNLDPNQLINGRRISPKRYSGYVSQKVRFDDNIALVNEENNVSQSKKESYVFETEMYGNYDFILKKRYIISPEVRFIYTEHSDQNTAEVYQNDSYVINVSLKNKYEHKVNNQPASLLFDIDYSRTNKDWQAQKKRELFATSTTFTIGESFSYFQVGDTTLRIKRKNYVGENEAISNHTTILSGDQTFFLPTQHLLVGLFEASFIDNFNNTTSSTDTYLLRFDYIVPQILPQYTLAVALGMTMTDTKEQESSRGTELSWNPSIDLSKELSERSKLSLNFDFTKNKSKSTSYSYSKNMLTMEYRYAF